ncbi:glycoside hydrolase family 113 [Saccharibacillus alkalitolerans]|uniref:1,4-beta-xylanase n=1 Tax=Saccharibacillus alkalitolerans TaxID=2705290 RepID=A0ABX0F333_9BACL|nr:1,4-beta-xylanase [Saccharibacillus alkalitolerans]NGZ75331.1 1,4-beta-xylanase [Saccharibacillus alkalitolerans]
MEKLEEFVCGMTWGFMGIRGSWGNDEARRSMREMAETTGADWIAIAFSALQDTAHSTEVRFREEPTVTDEEVRWAVAEAKSLGLKVCLKPIVNCADGTWRAHINFFDKDVPCEPKWSDWFASYGRFMTHYAEIAEQTGCEMFCVGCEMVQTDRRENEWRELIARVREAYSGIVTYNCDKYQEDNVTWWDSVDVVSSSGYYPSDDWEAQLDRIENVVRAAGKPFLFLEAGCPSREGSSAVPNDWTLEGGPDEEEQAAFYRAMFGSCERRSWVGGFMLWDWPARLYERESAAQDDGYCIYGKTAEGIVRRYYEGKRGKSE